MFSEDIDNRLALALTDGLGAVLIRRCLGMFNTAGNVLGASAADLATVEGLGSKRAEKIRRAIDAVLNSDAIPREKDLMAQQDVWLLPFGNAEYPKLLEHIQDPPMLLFVRGTLQPDDALSLAVVGSRKCTAYGREQADRLSAGCSQAGLTIISGGALGIDSAAHHATLRVGGRTIAVIGSGLARPYPAQNKKLFDQIADGNGAMISEYPMTISPKPGNFPVRNRIVSGMSMGTLVVEAANRSGALITARLAAEDHGREVMAVPGRIDSAASQGCHKIIRDGWATLVSNVQDILDALGETGRMLSQVANESANDANPDGESTKQTNNLTEPQQKLLAAMDQPLRPDQLSAATGLAMHQINAELTMLEIRGLIVRESGTFRRKK